MGRDSGFPVDSLVELVAGRDDERPTVVAGMEKPIERAFQK